MAAAKREVPLGAREPWRKVVVLARSSVRRISPPIADSVTRSSPKV